MERRNSNNPIIIALSVALVIMTMALAIVWTDSVRGRNEMAQTREASRGLDTAMKMIQANSEKPDPFAKMEADETKADLKAAQDELAKTRAELDRYRAEFQRMQNQQPQR